VTASSAGGAWEASVGVAGGIAVDGASGDVLPRVDGRLEAPCVRVRGTVGLAMGSRAPGATRLRGFPAIMARKVEATPGTITGEPPKFIVTSRAQA
jgi:hypothetical protein